jgi:hypothetical protein
MKRAKVLAGLTDEREQGLKPTPILQQLRHD